MRDVTEADPFIIKTLLRQNFFLGCLASIQIFKNFDFRRGVSTLTTLLKAGLQLLENKFPVGVEISFLVNLAWLALLMNHMNEIWQLELAHALSKLLPDSALQRGPQILNAVELTRVRRQEQ